MQLSDELIKQLMKQKDAHKHEDYQVDIELSEGYMLRNFNINKGQMRVNLMTSGHLAKWLFSNNELYNDKSALDMGCGTGIQGVIMGLYGANKVVFSDISEGAIKNTLLNVADFHIEEKSIIVQGNLFEKITDDFDIIVFNHPFFAFGSIDNLTKPNFSEKLCIEDQLIHTFLEEAKKYLKKNGVIIMPYFHMVGEINDPGVQAPKHDYKVVQHEFSITTGLQQGEVSICELRLK